MAVDVAGVIASHGLVALPISIDQGQTAGALGSEHRDPFDRMLVAQALTEKMAWILNKTAFDALHALSQVESALPPGVPDVVLNAIVQGVNRQRERFLAGLPGLDQRAPHPKPIQPHPSNCHTVTTPA